MEFDALESWLYLLWNFWNVLSNVRRETHDCVQTFRMTVANTELTWSLFASSPWFRLASGPSVRISVHMQYTRPVILSFLLSYPILFFCLILLPLFLWKLSRRVCGLLRLNYPHCSHFCPLPWEPYSVIRANLINYLWLEYLEWWCLEVAI